jgi:hypothetical protein
LLKSILLAFKQRLMHQLIADYIMWANASIEAHPAKTEPNSHTAIDY